MKVGGGWHGSIDLRISKGASAERRYSNKVPGNESEQCRVLILARSRCQREAAGPGGGRQGFN